MKKQLEPNERLIVAADFKPKEGSVSPWDYASECVLRLADSLKGTGVIIKVNSALRACGYRLISEIHYRGLQVFADLKLVDIPETLSTDGALISGTKPELITVMCSAGEKSLTALKQALPNTEVLGVTVLTSLTEDEVKTLYSASIDKMVGGFAIMTKKAGLDGLICSPKEIAFVRSLVGDDMTINTPNIRQAWAEVKGDDQNKARSMTIEDAIRAGVDRIVVGRLIVRAENPYDAVMRTIDEIAKAMQ